MDTVNTDMLRGRVDIIVLNALSEKDGYGYDILNYIQTRTQGHYQMKQSSIYSVLKRLEKLGQITSYAGGNETNGAKRRYYSLTDVGRDILENEKKEWSYTRTLLNNLVSDDNFDLLNDTPPFKPSDLRPLTKRIAVTDDSVEKSTDTIVAQNDKPDTAITKINNIEETKFAEVFNNNDNILSDAAKFSPKNESFTSIEQTTTFSPANNDILTNNFDSTTDYEEIIDYSKVAKTTNSTSEKADFKAVAQSPFNANMQNQPLNNQNNYSDNAKARHSNNAVQQLFHTTSENSSLNIDTTLKFDKEYSSKPVEKQNLNLYKDVLGSIFKTETPKSKAPNNEAFENIDCKYIYDLKAVLKNEGHQIKEYSPTDNKSTIKYLSFNKLVRDSLFLSFLFYVITVLALYLTRSYFEISKNTLFIVGGLGLIVPIAALFVYYQNPAKKKKDTVNLKLAINICFIVYLAAFMINLIIALILPNGYSLNSLHIYAPCFVLLTVPFYSLIFAALYKSDKYHLN